MVSSVNTNQLRSQDMPDRRETYVIKLQSVTELNGKVLSNIYFLQERDFLYNEFRSLLYGMFTTCDLQLHRIYTDVNYSIIYK